MPVSIILRSQNPAGVNTAAGTFLVKGSPLSINEMDLNLINLNNGKLDVFGGTVSGDLTVGVNNSNALTINSVASFNSNATFGTSSVVNIQNTTNTVNTTTGALLVAGGAYIARDVLLGGSSIKATAATFSLFPDVVTNLSIASGTSTTTILGSLVANTLSSTNATISGGSVTNTPISGSTGSFTSLTASSNCAINGGSLTTTASTANVFNTNATTLNIGGAATTVNLGFAGAGTTTTIGSNSVILSGSGAVRIPVGDTAARPTGAAGDIRFNNQLLSFEGFNASAWIPLGGVRSVDGLTYIIPETTPGASNDELEFYAANASNQSIKVGGWNVTRLLSNVNLSVTTTTASISTASGSIVANGGVGIAQDLFVGGLANVSGNLTVGGNLIINGTTTTVNSTVTTLDDPVITLGGDVAPTVDDNKDRGVEFRWHNGTAAKVGFFGYDDSTGFMTFIPDATNTNEVFSGATGVLDVLRITGSAARLTTPRTINGVSFDGSTNITITANTPNNLTFNNTGAGGASGTTFNGGAAVTISHNTIGALGLTGGTLTGQLISTLANNAANNGGQIFLNGANGNRIDFNAAGVAAPATTTRSAGTKIVLTPGVTATDVDYAFGIESGALWSSVASSGAQFKWYAATTNIATLTGTGNLTITGDAAINGGDLTTTATTATLFNTVATTLNIGQAATALSIGATTGTASINNVTVSLPNATTFNINGTNPTLASTSTGTLSLFNTAITTVNAFGAATTVTVGNTNTTTSPTFSILNAANTTGTKTLNLGTGGAAGSTTNVNIGTAGGGTSAIALNGATTISGNLTVNAITSNTANAENPTVSQIVVTNGTDNVYRKASITHLTSSLSGTAPISITGNAATATNATNATNVNGGTALVTAVTYIGATTASSGAVALNVSTANYFQTTATAAITYSFTNAPATGRAVAFILELTNGGSFAITWPTSVRWPGGTAPTLTVTGVDILTFITDDAGTTWRGVLSQRDSR